jgi:uncharacterized protein
VAASLLGGVLIGVAVAMLLLFNGRIAGISGIVAGLIAPRAPDKGETRWRVLFVAGLVIGGVVARILNPGALGAITTPLPILAIAGVLVGFGTHLGGGCTSGHGVCGVSRGSLRSIVATGTFMAVAIGVVLVVRHGGVR